MDRAGAAIVAAPRCVGGVRDCAGVYLVLETFASIGRGIADRAGDLRADLRKSVRAAWADVDALAGRRRIRGCLDRPVRRPLVRRKAAKLLYRSSLSAGRSSLADGQTAEPSRLEGKTMTGFLALLSSLIWWVLYGSIGAIVPSAIAWIVLRWSEGAPVVFNRTYLACLIWSLFTLLISAGIAAHIGVMRPPFGPLIASGAFRASLLLSMLI